MAEALYSPCRFVKISLYSVSVFYTHAKTTRQEIPTQVGGQEEDSEEASHIT